MSLGNVVLLRRLRFSLRSLVLALLVLVTFAALIKEFDPWVFLFRQDDLVNLRKACFGLDESRIETILSAPKTRDVLERIWDLEGHELSHVSQRKCDELPSPPLGIELTADGQERMLDYQSKLVTGKWLKDEGLFKKALLQGSRKIEIRKDLSLRLLEDKTGRELFRSCDDNVVSIRAWLTLSEDVLLFCQLIERNSGIIAEGDDTPFIILRWKTSLINMHSGNPVELNDLAPKLLDPKGRWVVFQSNDDRYANYSSGSPGFFVIRSGKLSEISVPSWSSVFTCNSGKRLFVVLWMGNPGFPHGVTVVDTESGQVLLNEVDGSCRISSDGKRFYTYWPRDNQVHFGPEGTPPIHVWDSESLVLKEELSCSEPAQGTLRSSDGQHKLEFSAESFSLYVLRRPEPWWGLAWLPTFWLTLLCAFGLFMSLRKEL